MRIYIARTYVRTYIYARHCDPRARVCTLIPLILRRHACCSCLSETRHRRRRSSRNKKALRGCVCMHRVGVCNTRARDHTQPVCTGCLANYFLRIFQDVATNCLHRGSKWKLEQLVVFACDNGMLRRVYQYGWIRHA